MCVYIYICIYISPFPILGELILRGRGLVLLHNAGLSNLIIITINYYYYYYYYYYY